MKKLLFTTLFMALVLAGGFSKAKKTDSADSADATAQTEAASAENSEGGEWKDVGNQGKKALKETGNFFKDLGKKIGSDVKDAAEDASEVKCLGKWGFNNGTTTITVNPGTIIITQKQGSDTYFWRGHYTYALKILTLTVEEEGTSSWTVSHDGDEDTKKFRITYSQIKDDENAMKFTCSDIPKDADGNSFSSAKVFTKM